MVFRYRNDNCDERDRREQIGTPAASNHKMRPRDFIWMAEHNRRAEDRIPDWVLDFNAKKKEDEAGARDGPRKP